MRTVLRRAVPPATTSTVVAGTPRLFATSFSSAVLAAPFSGTARTRARAWIFPSADMSTPQSSSRDDFGVSRT
ncbi:hypothetical protein BG36_06900 [Aquamicrobium defluvii]|uniref:Uncharacterized protein n=1 Tax=Aquamicrobium defluvii TaxID=69279 RepID=A0A011UJ92_9HYPH|nr:hypothetical protein BG36_06900 [Aquamicrobium defluvii]